MATYVEWLEEVVCESLLMQTVSDGSPTWEAHRAELKRLWAAVEHQERFLLHNPDVFEAFMWDRENTMTNRIFIDFGSCVIDAGEIRAYGKSPANGFCWW